MTKLEEFGFMIGFLLFIILGTYFSMFLPLDF